VILFFCTPGIRAQGCNANFVVFSNGNGNYTFSVTASPNNTLSTFNWTFPGLTPSTSVGQTVNVTFPNNITYTVFLQNITITPSCNATSSTVITVTSIPCPLFAAFTFTQAGNGLVFFSSNSSGTNGSTTYSWNLGITTSTLANPVVNYTVNGSYVVSLTVTNPTLSGCFSTVTQTIFINNIPTCSLTAGFTYTIGPNGQVAFSNTTTGTAPNTTYNWHFNNGQTSTLTSPPPITYTSNGTYTVSLAVNNPSMVGCNDSTFHVITISNIVNCNAGFTHTVGPNGQVFFTSTSLPASVTTQYQWSFGNGNIFNSVGNPTASTSYSANGVYPVTLTFSTAPCSGSVVINVTVTSIITPTCLIKPDFSVTYDSLGSVSFSNLTTGILPGGTYTWNFGDNTTSTQHSPAHTYTANGPYTVTLFAQDSICSADTVHFIGVTTNTCYPALITHTVSNSGVATFSSAYGSNLPGASYFWDFGDGYTGTGGVTTHTYQNGGTHYVTHWISHFNGWCSDSITQAVNITGVACTANAGFTVLPSMVPQYWVAIPYYPWNVTAATWSWGDGSSSNSMYPSHTYSTAGNYNICLTVTASCGNTATACSSYSLYRTSAAMVHINVLKPQTTGISESFKAVEAMSIDLFPNPANDVIHVRCLGLPVEQAQMIVTDLTGRELLLINTNTDHGDVSARIDLGQLSSGLYNLTIRSGALSQNRRFVVNK
jgi:PKD repeat protein